MSEQEKEDSTQLLIISNKVLSTIHTETKDPHMALAVLSSCLLCTAVKLEIPWDDFQNVINKYSDVYHLMGNMEMKE